MQFIKFKKDDFCGYGVIEDNTITKLKSDIFDNTIIKTSATYNISEVIILPPCNPTKIIAVGLNYKSHAIEFGEDIPDEPKIFLKPPSSIIAHKEKIVIPKQSVRVDYEAELAIIISKTAKDIKQEDANKYILGYTCLNDVTARDLQKKDGQWIRAKGFDTFCPIGPYITTDINANNLDIRLEQNGKVMQQSNTSNFIFDVEFIVSYVSSIMTLNKGDIITTGTPDGVGPMKKGDEIKVIIDRVGELINYVK